MHTHHVDQLAPSVHGALTRLNVLSPRETEVFDLLAEAPSYEEIADTLGISKRTVKHHLSNIREKLGGVSYIQTCVVSHLHHNDLMDSLVQDASA